MFKDRGPLEVIIMVLVEVSYCLGDWKLDVVRGHCASHIADQYHVADHCGHPVININ